MSCNEMVSGALKFYNALQRNQKHKLIVCRFLHNLFGFVNNGVSIYIIPDKYVTNESSTK